MTVPPSLPRRQLGRTGMEITRVGFGSWAVGGGDWQYGWGPQDDHESVAAIRRALDLGVNWIDTAAVYGLGHSEEVVASALRGIPPERRPLVFTKCGMVPVPGRPGQVTAVGRPDSIRSELEASLRRLEVERIDLYQMHWPPDDGTPLEDYWGTILELKREGKIRAAGLSNHDLAQLQRAERLGHVDSLQPPFSLIDRAAAAELIPWCRTSGTGVIVYSPMQSGLLTGGFSRERAASLDPSDWRAGDPEFNGDRLSRNLELADRLAAVGERRGLPVAAMAVAWTLAWPGVTGAIVGARRPQQVEGWIGAAEAALTTAELDEIAAFASPAGSGPLRP